MLKVHYAESVHYACLAVTHQSVCFFVTKIGARGRATHISMLLMCVAMPSIEACHVISYMYEIATPDMRWHNS